MSNRQSTGISSFIFRFRYHLFFALAATVSFLNLTIDIMEVDAAQYASISRSMSESGSYLQVFHRGEDYLDKPPLLFWLSSLSISIFGNTNVGYKLPAVILLWLAVWATYRLGKIMYDRQVGIFAALLLCTCQGFYLMTNDVRTDGLLTSFVILSAYFLYGYIKDKDVLSLIAGGCCLGLAMLAKGPLGLIIPGVAIGGHLIISAQWKKIFDWRWLLLLPTVLTVLAPMLYGLYVQFDLHPEKEVYGLKGPSGLRFFFWTQSFGRITGESSWQDDSSFFYFFLTILWDFAPWILFFIPALIIKFNSIFNGSGRSGEWVTFCGFAIPFLALSFSNYKLPHYIFPLFPFAAILTASFLQDKIISISRRVEIIMISLLHIFIVLSILSYSWVFPRLNIAVVVSTVLLLLLFIAVRRLQINRAEQMVLSICALAFIFQFTFALHFYPNLLKYQSTSQAGQLIKAYDRDDVYWHRKYGYALDYYAGFHVKEWKEDLSKDPGCCIVYTDAEGLNDFTGYRILREFDDYPVTLLRIPFLDPRTRNEVVKKTFLIAL